MQTELGASWRRGHFRSDSHVVRAAAATSVRFSADWVAYYDSRVSSPSGAGKLLEELTGSRVKLESLLNQEVKAFALPYGAYNDTVLKSCREAGYERVFTGLPVFAFAQPREFLTGRVVVGLTDWPIEFRLKAAGAYRWLPWAFALKRRILAGARGKRGEAAHAYS